MPRPYPDYNASGFHYLPGRKTPLRDEGNLHVVDDFQPRAALKNLHQQDIALTSSDETAGIKDFSGKYIVSENLARNYLQHLEHLELLKEKQQKEENQRKKQENRKKYEDYDWQDLYQQKNISSLRVQERDKYLAYHSLSKRTHKMKKKDKLLLVETHIAITQFPTLLSDDTEGNSELDEDGANAHYDIVICELGALQSGEPEKFCLCRQPEDGQFMICCDSCDKWFHGDCIAMSEEEAEKYMSDLELKFICPLCVVT